MSSEYERKLRSGTWDVVLNDAYPWRVQYWSRRNQEWRSESWKGTMQEALDDMVETIALHKQTDKHPPTMRIWNFITDDVIMGDTL